MPVARLICPHKGFPLNYKASDKTLNCPGHYSRFDCENGGQEFWGHATQNLPQYLLHKRVVYDLLMKAAAETTLAIAADPRRLGARIGITAVLHTGARRSPIIRTCI